jgi:hypothetical protein
MGQAVFFPTGVSFASYTLVYHCLFYYFIYIPKLIICPNRHPCHFQFTPFSHNILAAAAAVSLSIPIFSYYSVVFNELPGLSSNTFSSRIPCLALNCIPRTSQPRKQGIRRSADPWEMGPK